MSYEQRCYYCKEWFTRKRKNGNFCSKECSDRACWLRYNRSPNGVLRRMKHYRKHKEKIYARRMKRRKAKKLYGDKWREYIDKL